MSRIRILPDHVANQIAAGEVVERPSSVLKELLENSLDAGATRLDLRWEEGGKRMLEVADDGCGLDRDDLYMALERHATSKVRTADDLGRLSSFGFRGEALPSIASVTRFEMLSAVDEGRGHRLRSEFGVVKDLQPIARSRGTTITVRDLFGQLPARKRFLKSTETEHAHLWGIVTRLALATPDIHWSVRTDRSTDLVMPPVAESGARLSPLLGEKMAALVPFRNGEAPWTLHGYLSPPDLSFRDRNHLYLFVNGRTVRDRLLLASLATGWEGIFAKGAYPAVLLFLDVPPEAVDVNVHPTKAEVRFRESQRIFPWVSGCVREAWQQMKGLPSLLENTPGPLEMHFAAPEQPSSQRPLPWRQESTLGATPALNALVSAFPSSPLYDAHYPLRAVPCLAAESPELSTGIRYLGSFQKTYLLVEVMGETEPELWIVDQHVAHERILYERIFERRHIPVVQPLLPPRVIHMGPEAVSRISPFLEELAGAGVDLEVFGSNSVAVRGLPDFLTNRDPESLLEDLLHRLEDSGKVDLDAFRKELNAELACRSAIKKHEHLAPELALRLIQDLLQCESPQTCPHGRPVIKKITLTDLERIFGRRG